MHTRKFQVQLDGNQRTRSVAWIYRLAACLVQGRL